jgi:hypothetical protein
VENSGSALSGSSTATVMEVGIRAVHMRGAVNRDLVCKRGRNQRRCFVGWSDRGTHLQTASSAFPEENLGRETRDRLDKMTASSQCTIGNAPWSFVFMAAYQSRQHGREPELERKGALSCLLGVAAHANWVID